MTQRTTHMLSIDVEDYWSVFSRDWLMQDAFPSSAVVKNTHWFLQILDDFKTKATFFILREVAEKFPSLVRQIASSGHEIASHGSSHKQVFKMDPKEFQSEIRECRNFLEETISDRILGYRAPAFSIMPRTRWALDILAREGFAYDSSIYPISGRRYGWPGFCPDICKIPLAGDIEIIEVPMSSITVMGKSLPVAGGGYLRHFPCSLTKYAIKRIQRVRPVVVYMHPYEIDLESKSFSVSHLPKEQKRRALKFHQMQLRNRKTVGRKLICLLSRFEFTTIGRAIETAKVNVLPVFDIANV